MGNAAQRCRKFSMSFWPSGECLTSGCHCTPAACGLIGHGGNRCASVCASTVKRKPAEPAQRPRHDSSTWSGSAGSRQECPRHHQSRPRSCHIFARAALSTLPPSFVGHDRSRRCRAPEHGLEYLSIYGRAPGSNTEAGPPDRIIAFDPAGSRQRAWNEGPVQSRRRPARGGR